MRFRIHLGSNQEFGTTVQGAFLYAVIGFAGMGVATAIGIYLVNNLARLMFLGYGQQAYYILLVWLWIATAVVLFGIFRSIAALLGNQFDYAIGLGAPAVVAALGVFGAVYSTKLSFDEFGLLLSRSDCLIKTCRQAKTLPPSAQACRYPSLTLVFRAGVTGASLHSLGHDDLCGEGWLFGPFARSQEMPDVDEGTN